MNLVSLSDEGYHSLADIVACLRCLADDIESGDYGEVFHLGWIIDRVKDGEHSVAYGLQGKATNVDCVFNMLLDQGKAKLIKDVMA